jgi:uncharacterized membrane protein YkvA (DUF1232 family)/CelD/BcsL family acetyltransferase involved in cellulose biosynthesis
MKRVRIVAASDASQEPHIRAKWVQLLDQYSGTTLFYQSPEYFNHLARLRADRAFLAIVEGDDGEPIGIVPLRKSPVLLKFEVRKRHFAKVSFSGIRILGGTLLAPQSSDVFELVFQQIARSFPDCDAMEVTGLSTTSILWDFLRNNGSLARDFTIYVPNGPRICHTARVPGSYTEYLGRFGRKKQYNLKRQIRRLDRFGNGTLALHRIDRVSVVKHLQSARIALGDHARPDVDRQVSETELLDLAERGLLLSYVLSVNGKPCGLAFGTRFRDTLLLHHFRHDAEINHLSPGTVLQTLMMKDLAEHRLARLIDYGFGEPRYRLTNELNERVSVVMVRRGRVNESLIGAHREYVRLVDGVKRLVRHRRRTVDDPGVRPVDVEAGIPARHADGRPRLSIARPGWHARLIHEARVFIAATVDRRVPWYARLSATAMPAAYLLAPIDPIPNRLPVIGHLDDAIVAVLAIALFVRLVPPALRDRLRADLQQPSVEKGLAVRPGMRQPARAALTVLSLTVLGAITAAWSALLVWAAISLLRL